MSVRNNHNRTSEKTRLVIINEKKYTIHNGNFTTPSIVRNTVAKLKNGTLKFDENKSTIIIHGGIFETVTIEQY